MRRPPDPRILVAALAAAAAVAGVAACGTRGLREGVVPFPAGRPVLADAAGTPRTGLPPCAEPLRLVVIDAPWCPPCADAWRAVREAKDAFPPGSVRVFRLLFERERLFQKEGSAEAPPISPAPEITLDNVPVTTLRVLPKAFRAELRVDRVPVLLLLDAEGRIVRRWNGYSPGLARDLAASVTRRPSPSPPPET